MAEHQSEVEELRAQQQEQVRERQRGNCSLSSVCNRECVQRIRRLLGYPIIMKKPVCVRACARLCSLDGGTDHQPSGCCSGAERHAQHHHGNTARGACAHCEGYVCDKEPVCKHIRSGPHPNSLSLPSTLSFYLSLSSFFLSVSPSPFPLSSCLSSLLPILLSLLFLPSLSALALLSQSPSDRKSVV